VAGAGSSRTPLRDNDGSVHWLRSQQQAARFPDLSFERVLSIRIARVSGFLVAPIQRIQSQRARGVMSSHTVRTCGLDASAFARSAGTSGSGHCVSGSSATDTESPTCALAPSSNVLSTLNQWLPIPSGSSGVRNAWPLQVPSTMVNPRERSLLLAASGSLRIGCAPIAVTLAWNLIFGIHTSSV
jgi:hypothetical protein